jgi:Transposase DDE domain
VNELAQFLAYTTKVFQLKQRLRAVRDERVYPVIPTQAVLLSLLFAVVLRVGSYLALSQKTARRRWRHLIHWDETISDDTLDYVTERLRLDDLRQWLVAINRELKTNKVLEPAKINGLLFLSLDANEHFHSESYCCESCCRREVTQHDSKGQKQTVTQFYHRYVFAQISGAKVTLLLDLEPIRPGEDEAGAALRLLGRIRRLYGPRFFDAVTVDGWYAQGPFLRAIEKLGWDWVVVLKKERMELLQEARRLTLQEPPQVSFKDGGRQRDIQLWEVKDLSFSEGYGGGTARVVHSQENWMQTTIEGGKRQTKPQQSDWWWAASERKLGGYPSAAIYHAGHRRWGIENRAFRELTVYYHLEHCYHHHPVAMLAQMFILLIGFTLFQSFAHLHSQAIRARQTSLKDLTDRLREALQEDLPWNLWFASG